MFVSSIVEHAAVVVDVEEARIAGEIMSAGKTL